MQVRRALVAIGMVICGVWLLSTPAAAQSVNRNLIDELNAQFMYVALPLTLFVEVILVYAVLRFRDNDDPKPTIEAPPLEITWTIATAIILLFVGVSAYVVLANPYISSEAATINETTDVETVEVLSYQWGWEFTYEEANVTTQGQLVIPANETVALRITSADVIHSLFIPELGIKKDSFPGEYTTVRTKATKIGAYRAYCTELCGVGHSRMQANVTVVNQSTYQRWLSTHAGQQNVTAIPAVDS